VETWAAAAGNPWKKGTNAGNGQATMTSNFTSGALDGYWVNGGVVTPAFQEQTIITGYGELEPTSVAFAESASSIAYITDPGAKYHERVYKVTGGVSHVAIDALDPGRIYYVAAGSDNRPYPGRDRRQHKRAGKDRRPGPAAGSGWRRRRRVRPHGA